MFGLNRKIYKNKVTRGTKMPRMSNTKRAISMTRSDTWTTSFAKLKVDDEKIFCIEFCPHKETPCNGDCPEMKEFRKINKKT